MALGDCTKAAKNFNGVISYPFVSYLPLKPSRSSTRLGSIVDDPSVDWFSPFLLETWDSHNFLHSGIRLCSYNILIISHQISLHFLCFILSHLFSEKAQNFLHLLVETLEQHALADASVERSRWRTPCAREGRAPLLRARLADLMAMLLWKLSCKLHKVQLQIYGTKSNYRSLISLHIWRDLNAWDLLVVGHGCT